MVEIISFISTIITMKILLKVLVPKDIVQPIYDDALEGHQSKIGTPTMGGLAFIITIVAMMTIMAVKLNDLISVMYLGSIIILIGYGYIGFRDDYSKVTKKDNQSGLTPKQKLIFQFLISGLLMIVLFIFNASTIINFHWFSIDLIAKYNHLISTLYTGITIEINGL